MNQELLEKIVTLAAKDPERYQRRSGDDATEYKHQLSEFKS